MFQFGTSGGPARLQLQPYLSLPHGGWNDRGRIGRMYLTCLRTACSPLAYHLEDSDHLCILCGSAREKPDETHFLLDCSAFREERGQMAAFINAAVEHAERKFRNMPVPPFDFASLPRLSQLRILLGAGQLEPRFSPVWSTVTLALMRQIGQWMMRVCPSIFPKTPFR